jgi:membrane-associated protease RseP (regulator of RpoE activity)
VPRRPPRWLTLAVIHGGLFLATAASTTAAFYASFSAAAPGVERLIDSLTFSLPALLILGSHEMGHYLMARAHGVDVSLPYFIPAPFSFGTLGAVIRLKGRLPSRDALLDVGAGGPLAGLAVALPLLVTGVMLSHPVPAPAPPFPPSFSLLHLGAELGHALRRWLDGTEAPPLAIGATYFGDNLLTLGLTRLIWGRLPEGMDLDAHPVFIAAWFGLLVTMLNLVPVGQLDGGHVLRAALGERAARWGPHVASLALICALFFSASWLVWFFLMTKVVGFEHPPPIDDETPLSPGRRAFVYATWALTVACFIPVPFDVLG